MRTSMKAVVIERPGPPEVLKLQERPVPKPKPGWALIRVRAFGLNRSEMFTRQGHSPAVTFPRILGIEAVGEILAAALPPQCACLSSTGFLAALART